MNPSNGDLAVVVFIEANECLVCIAKTAQDMKHSQPFSNQFGCMLRPSAPLNFPFSFLANPSEGPL